MSDTSLNVRSHVGRDITQSAALFNTDRKAVWEYIVNSLQYIDAGVAPVVHVLLDSRNHRIEVRDNGRGMDWTDLDNFFRMHGENVDRRAGNPGRGFFGTGKCAAFGIADTLRVRTIRNGVRNTVELTREAIESDAAYESVPVDVLERNTPTDESNGTTVFIERVKLQKIDEPRIIELIERKVAYMRRDAAVYVNNRLCEFTEPAVEREWRFKAAPPLLQRLGDVTLVLRKAYAPLDDELRGVAIVSSGNVHEVTLGTSRGKDMSQYLFGHVEVPMLDSDESTPPPFTMDRGGELNRSNALVQAVFAFIDPHITEVRQELVEEEKRRRDTEEMQRLTDEASRIASVINDDFKEFQHRLAQARQRAMGTTDINAGLGAELGDDVLLGNELPAEHTPLPAPSGSSTRSGEGEPASTVTRNDDSEDDIARAAGGEGKRRSHRGGFSVRFQDLGAEELRSKYVADERTILVNIGHPQLVAARGDKDLDDSGFRRLSYEVAFTEYAVAVAQEQDGAGYYMDPQEALFDIRERIDKMARRAAVALYRE